MSTWIWVLSTHAGEALAELDTATNRTLTFKRNAAPEAQLTLGLQDTRAELLTEALANGLPLLRCYQGEPGSRTLRFHGVLTRIEEQAAENGTLTTSLLGQGGVAPGAADSQPQPVRAGVAAEMPIGDGVSWCSGRDLDPGSLEGADALLEAADVLDDVGCRVEAAHRYPLL